MDFSSLKRRGGALALVAAALSSVSGVQSSTAIAAPVASGASVPSPAVSSSAAGRLVVDPGQRPVRRVVQRPAVTAARVPVAKVTKAVPAVPVSAVKKVAVSKAAAGAAQAVKGATVGKGSVASKPVAKAAVKVAAKSKVKPVAKPRSAPKAKPAPVQPSQPKQAAPAFQAPSVHYAGATCRKTGANSWSITHSWTATGGSYVDLGSAQNRTSPVVVTGGSRTWTFVTTEVGSSAPEVTDAVLGRIIAPIGKAGDVSAWRSVERQMDMVQVRC